MDFWASARSTTSIPTTDWAMCWNESLRIPLIIEELLPHRCTPFDQLHLVTCGFCVEGVLNKGAKYLLELSIFPHLK